MKSNFVPDSWVPRNEDLIWAVKTFRIEQKEALRQIELMRDHEFKRNYTDWNRVFRNWMRKSEEIGTLRRVIHRQPDEYTEEQRKQDAIKAWQDLNRLRGVK